MHCIECGHENRQVKSIDETCPACGVVYRNARLQAQGAGSSMAAAIDARDSSAHAAARATGIAVARGGRAVLLALAGVFVLGVGYQACSDMGDSATQRAAQAQQQDAAARTSQVQRAIAEQRVLVGMQAAEVLAAWGEPSNRHETVAAGGAASQWAYERGGAVRQYVYLRDGRVTSISTSQ